MASSSSTAARRDREPVQPNPLTGSPVTAALNRLRGPLTLTAIAHAAGLSLAYISLLWSGKRGRAPSLDVVTRLATALGVTETEVMDALNGRAR